jgi:nucleotide-binding universal stress UspA family protein
MIFFRMVSPVTEVILAVVEHPEQAAPTLDAAAVLAGLVGGATINALAIRLPPEAAVVPGKEVPARRHAAEIRRREAARVALLRAEFERWRAHAAVPAQWNDIEASSDAAVTEWGGRADAIVVMRPLDDDTQADRAALDAALRHSDRPVLLVPPGGGGFGRRIAIAWRDDKQAIKALLPALRWLLRAEHVHVLAGIREGAPTPVLPAILAEHGIMAELHALPIGPGPFGETLLATAHALDADLLVAGAYAHGKLHQLALGGVTSWLLAHADLPVLTRH